LQGASAADSKKALDIALAQYAGGVIDLTRVTLLQQNLVGLEDTLAQAQGEIATGLIQVYRALGGGWQIRLAPDQGQPAIPPSAAARPAEMIPLPTIPEPVTVPVPVPAPKS
jgi:hypothetical protein